MDCQKNAKDQITAYLKDAVRAVQAENIETDEAIGRCDDLHPGIDTKMARFLFRKAIEKHFH